MVKVFPSALWESKKNFRRKVAVVTYQKRFAEYIRSIYIQSRISQLKSYLLKSFL